jgi:hypothetical protein
LFYFSGDLGYNLLQRQTYKIGAFAGIFHEREVVNAHGCAQIATNNQICSPTISDPVLAITEDSRWTAARVGLNGEVTLWNLIKINVDGAWLPYVMLDSADTHWLRIQPVAGNFMGPIPQDGIGHNGFQLESVVSYLVSPAFSVGIGARYWRMETSGNAHFEGDIYGGSGSPQPVHFVTERYGGFLQVLTGVSAPTAHSARSHVSPTRVCCWGLSGKYLLVPSITGFDPERTSSHRFRETSLFAVVSDSAPSSHVCRHEAGRLVSRRQFAPRISLPGPSSANLSGCRRRSLQSPPIRSRIGIVSTPCSKPRSASRSSTAGI